MYYVPKQKDHEIYARRLRMLQLQFRPQQLVERQFKNCNQFHSKYGKKTVVFRTNFNNTR